MNTCQIDGCERPAATRDMCQAHYLRWWRWRRGISGRRRFPLHVPVGDNSPREIPDEKRDRIVKLARWGLDHNTIARRVGVSHNTAKRYLAMPQDEEAA